MKEELEFVDLTILMPGAAVPLLIAKSQMEQMDKTLEEITNPAHPDFHKWFCIQLDGYKHRFAPKGVMGWYFKKRYKPEMSEAQKKQLELMAKLEKKLPDESSGDNWKQSGD